jgi:D-alanine-D-alanine ligase
VIPALAHAKGLRAIGSEHTAYALCQDKFRSGAVLKALGVPVPETALARNGELLTAAPHASAGYFVKPNRLGSKIGIWPDSRCRTMEEALALSRRVHDAYGDDVVIQAYVPGENVRSSFLAVDPQAGATLLDSYYVDSSGDFQTMTDSLALYGDTGAAAKRAGTYQEPKLRRVGDSSADADAAIREIAGTLMRALSVRDVFSMDLRVEPDGRVHFIEFEVCPGLICFDFRHYCRTTWHLPLAQAVAETAARRMREWFA